MSDFKNYEDFLKVYSDILLKSVKKLKLGKFFIIVIVNFRKANKNHEASKLLAAFLGEKDFEIRKDEEIIKCDNEGYIVMRFLYRWEDDKYVYYSNGSWFFIKDKETNKKYFYYVD